VLVNSAPHAAKWTDWTAGGVLTLFEEYNGLGYAAMGVPSAYVWSGTDQYVSGKYIADHVYRASAVDVQEGVAPILAMMMALDPSILFAKAA
jgi:lysozyme family protein